MRHLASGYAAKGGSETYSRTLAASRNEDCTTHLEWALLSRILRFPVLAHSWYEPLRRRLRPKSYPAAIQRARELNSAIVNPRADRRCRACRLLASKRATATPQPCRLAASLLHSDRIRIRNLPAYCRPSYVKREAIGPTKSTRCRVEDRKPFGWLSIALTVGTKSAVWNRSVDQSV